MRRAGKSTIPAGFGIVVVLAALVPFAMAAPGAAMAQKLDDGNIADVDQPPDFATAKPERDTAIRDAWRV